MKPVLFVVTELERPVGGLYRFTTEFASTWRAAVPKVELQLLGFKDPLAPLENDLKPASEYAGFRHKVFRAPRAGQQALFIEPVPEQSEVEQIQEELWREYGVRSMNERWDYYRSLCVFWKAVPEFIEYSRNQLGKDFSLVDCQDWLAFPAGFMARKKLGLPLHCRFHSTEMGRSLGSPDFEAAPFSIETAALLEADFIQGVSVSETKFLFYHYLPYAMSLRDSLAPVKPSGWAAYVNDKFEDYQNFLVYEPQDLVLYSEWAAGVPNGIILDSWKKVTAKDVARGRQLLKEILPGKKHYLLFVGRTETRKGIAQLIEAMALLDDDSLGLVLVSSFAPDVQKHYEEMIASRGGLAARIAVHSSWVSDEDKRALFCACDIMVFPSLYEPFGLVCLEGLAADFAAKRSGLYGPIIVASATGGLNEILRTGLNGFKVPMQGFDLKPELLARVLRVALRNKDSAHPVSVEGARRVQDPSFNWATIARTVRKSYSIAIKNIERRGGLMESAEVFGVNAGKVWLCLKGGPALSLSEIKSKTKLSTEEAAASVGWLGRENKLYIENSGKARKYGLRE